MHETHPVVQLSGEELSGDPLRYMIDAIGAVAAMVGAPVVSRRKPADGSLARVCASGRGAGRTERPPARSGYPRRRRRGLAGPGSGKTRVLTVRAAHLLATSVPRRSALAAITFTNAAADEMRERLGRLGLPQSRRVSIGTAHAFCLNEILLTHRDILPRTLPDTVKILSERAAGRVESAVLTQHGIADTFDAKLALTRARRGIATGGTLAGGDEPFRAAADAYAQTLHERGVLDFEEVIVRALEALKIRPSSVW